MSASTRRMRRVAASSKLMGLPSPPRLPSLASVGSSITSSSTRELSTKGSIPPVESSVCLEPPMPPMSPMPRATKPWSLLWPSTSAPGSSPLSDDAGGLLAAVGAVVSSSASRKLLTTSLTRAGGRVSMARLRSSRKGASGCAAPRRRCESRLSLRLRPVSPKARSKAEAFPTRSSSHPATCPIAERAISNSAHGARSEGLGSARSRTRTMALSTAA
mmetsp:Transcript_128360/g.399511  ORF Transcript_128360/g.399511 Transcript_128360/m.399511 type:complete len:217 (+) Transcript_128360:416-1066(+)